MDEGQDTSKAYEVGYGKPPKHTQFKKGQSGNPSGKRKKEETLRSQLTKIVSERLPVQQNGTLVTMRKDEAMLNSVVIQAMKGDLPSVRYVTDVLGVDAGADAGVPAFVLSEADLRAIDSRETWLGIREEAEKSLRESEGDDEP